MDTRAFSFFERKHRSWVWYWNCKKNPISPCSGAHEVRGNLNWVYFKCYSATSNSLFKDEEDSLTAAYSGSSSESGNNSETIDETTDEFESSDEIVGESECESEPLGLSKF